MQRPRPRKKRNYDPNKARKEQQLELIQLQQEAKDLELTLQHLQTFQRGRADFRTSVGSACRLSDGGIEVPAVWEEICTRQLQRRLKVELENTFLKKKYEDEQSLVKSIEKVLYKRLKLRELADPSATKHPRRIEIPAGFVNHVSGLIFEQLSAGVEVSFREVDDVFEPYNPEHGSQLTHEPMLLNEMNGMYLELTDNQILPFDMHATGEAWWRRWHNFKGQRVQENGDIAIAEKYGLEMVDDNTKSSAIFYTQQVLRRHVESNRIVIVCHVHIEPVEFETKRVSGIQFQEKGYVLIRPCNSESETDSVDNRETCAMVSTCYVIIPHLSDANLQEDAKVAALTKLVVSAMSANISKSTEMIENLLVDQALQKRSCIF